MKITQIKISLDFSTVPTQSLSYQLYSALLGYVDTEYADFLHEQDAFAISQYLCADSSEWVLSLFGDEACQQFVPALDCGSFNLRSSGTAKIKDIRIEQREKIIGTGGNENTVKLTFVTPTSFKSNGKYENFPTAAHIAGSIIQKWRRCEGDIIDDELAHKIADSLEISRYALKSTVFRMKNTCIPAFVGEVEITSRLNGMHRKIWNSIADFSNYSGVGIKTALGMGGTKTVL